MLKNTTVALPQKKIYIYTKEVDGLELSVIFHGKNIYTVEGSEAICTGFYKQLSKNSFKVELTEWINKKTNRKRGKNHKLYNHTRSWFASIVAQAIERNIQNDR